MSVSETSDSSNTLPASSFIHSTNRGVVSAEDADGCGQQEDRGELICATSSMECSENREEGGGVSVTSPQKRHGNEEAEEDLH